MTAIIEPSPISGSVKAPPSKSLSQRAIAAAFLHKGATTLTGAGDSEDELAALSIIRSFGADVQQNGHDFLIRSTGLVSSDCREINCGESGLAARLFTPIAATASHAIRITARGTLLERSMAGLFAALRALGVECTAKTDLLPVTVQGPIIPADIALDGSGGSQVLSGILFALSNLIGEPLTLSVTNLQSRSYIDLTISVLDQFGGQVRHDDYGTFYIQPKCTAAHQNDQVYSVEGDWSNAAFWIVAAAISSAPLCISNLNPDSLQGDRSVLSILEKAGVSFDWSLSNMLTLSGAACFRGFNADLDHTPDLFPILAILAARIDGESRLSGIHRLTGKESNRVESICGMLAVLGVTYRTDGDSFVIQGGRHFNGGTVSSCNDHRIVMAAAVAGLVAESAVSITAAEAVAKSYPAFFTDMQSLGARVRLIPAS